MCHFVFGSTKRLGVRSSISVTVDSHIPHPEIHLELSLVPACTPIRNADTVSYPPQFAWRNCYLVVPSSPHTMSLRSKSSPIHSLPPEVLSRIFQSYCDIYHPLNADCICFKTSIYSLEDARIIIQKVCRLWRATALADPRLWATVTLYVPSCMKASSDSRRGTQEKQSYLRIAKERLARSGDLPLTLAFQFFEWHIATVEDSITLFQMFLDVLPRVEHLVMDVEFRDEWDDGVLAGKPSPLSMGARVLISCAFYTGPGAMHPTRSPGISGRPTNTHRHNNSSLYTARSVSLRAEASSACAAVGGIGAQGYRRTSRDQRVFHPILQDLPILSPSTDYSWRMH
ncbi:hypothetical protein BDZ89DRAFT_629385 [Hymenopellis radicata]|nr:hypothetical protein BDZ89DRAFT_629385 [Hymenopellis radicata]